MSFGVSNHAGSSEASGLIALSSNTSTAGQSSHIDETESDPLLAIDLGTVARYSTSTYNEPGKQVQETRAYFDIPASGAGTDGTNYDPTKMAYDVMGRRIRTLQASGTITRTEFDALGRATTSKVGTDDTGDAEGMTGGTNNMTQRSATVYDGGSDGGNSLVTRRTRYWGSTSSHTDMEYDARGRTLLVENPVSPHQFYKYDNRGRQIAVGSFSSTASITVGSDDPTTETANRLSLSESTFDSRGRAAARTRHSIDPMYGTTEDPIEDEQWFDVEGRLVKVTGSSYAKYAYDRIGRRTHTFLLGGDNDSSYADADDVTGDIVLEENQTVYDDDGRVVMQLNIQRFHDDDSAGTTGALETNADGDRFLVTAANLEGRASITGIWYEEYLDRQKAVVQYGTYGGSNFDRDGLSLPTRSDTALVTSYEYADDGRVETVTDPKSIKSHSEVDDLGRTTVTIANYGDGTPSGTDSDQRIVYGYTDGLRTTITADVPGGGDQVTTYTYGTTKGVSAGDSEIATGHLLQSVAYPDSTGSSDVVSYAYDRQGRQHWVKDQAGTIIETAFDDAGRETSRAVTTLASGFNGDVRRIETSYTNRGQVENVTQYDAATSGTAVDQVEYTYARHGGVESFRQDMNGLVDGVSSVDDYEVEYTWALSTGARQSWRRSGVTMPSGKALTYEYGSGIDDEVSRLSIIKDGALRLAEYDYLGYTRVVGQTYAIPDLMQEYYGSTSGDYSGFDRFGRVVRSRWQRDTGSGDIDVYDVELAYDRNSNITLAEDAIIPGRDVEYTMDGLNRLVQAEEGTWSGSAITSKTRDEQWTLDHLGNWDSHQLDLNGDTDYDDADELDETRTHNAVNELLTRDLDSDMSTDETLAYNAVGELVDDGAEFEYVYDAFGRLCEVFVKLDVEDPPFTKLVAEYRYNGLGFQIGELTDTNVDGDVDGSDLWYYSAFDERWRKLATFRSSDSDPKEEFVPHNAGLNGGGGSSYINDTVLRDKDVDEDVNHILEQRIFYLNNWRGDVVGLVTSTGYQGEFVRYSAYGTPFNYPGGDANSDGETDAADGTVISGWVAGMIYDLRGDLDLDGDVDASDSTAFGSVYTGGAGGLSVLSTVGGRNGYGGILRGIGSLYGARSRVFSDLQGKWLLRDPLQFIDGPNQFLVFLANPVRTVDPYGLFGYVAGGEVYGPPQIDVFAPPPYYKWPGGILPSPCEEACQKWFDNMVEVGEWLAGATVCSGLGSTPCVCMYDLESFPAYPDASLPVSPPFPKAIQDALDEATGVLTACTEIHEAEHAKNANCVTIFGSEEYPYGAGDLPSPIDRSKDDPKGLKASNAATEACFAEKQGSSESCQKGSLCDTFLSILWADSKH